MCGIAGIFAYHSNAASPNAQELEKIRDAMARRGPDGVGAWHSADQRLRLAHRRLSIIDIGERADQPLLSTDGRFAIVFNGEIYNYRELKAELLAKGARFATESDTEVIMELFRVEGSKAFARLRGMFALALYDHQSQCLTLARDPYGIKPLYLADDGQTLRFASSTKALVAGQQVSAAIDPAAEVGLLLFGHVPEPHTWFAAVKSLPAGSYLTLQNGQKHSASFSTLAAMFASSQAAGQSNISAAELAERSTAALRDSLRAHLVADVPVGIFLSAGVDSSALLGMMRDVSNLAIKATTLRFAEYAGQHHDEAPLASLVAQQYGADHEVVTIGESDFMADMQDFFAVQDQPTLDGINTWLVAKASARRGLKVALSGVGGDELFAGYPSFRELPRWKRMLALPSSIPGFGVLVRRIMQSLGGFGLHPKAAGMIELAHSWAGLYLLRRGVFMPWELDKLLDSERLNAGLQALAWPQAIGSLVDHQLSDTAQVGLLESSLYMRNQLLRDTDWASMAHSLEVRTPLVDAHLLSQLGPLVARFGDGDGKRLMANAPAKPLPTEITTRRKTGFTTPAASWIAKHPEFQRWQQRPGMAKQHWSRPFTLTVGALAGANWQVLK